MDLQKIFEDEPTQWGLRGDPYLWQALKNEVLRQPNFATESDFTDCLISAFESLVGQELLEGKIYYVKEFNHGGMSRGGVSCDFWLNTGFPMLIKKFKSLTP